MALLTDLDSDNGDSNDKVTLMTIHSAKGLEFPTVFVVGLEENIFPSPMSINSIRELEEERRLLYVAITRAEKHCILTCAQNRWRYGRMEYDTPSRFIRDIDPGLLDTQGEKGGDVLPFSGSRSSGWMQNPVLRLRSSRPIPSPVLSLPASLRSPLIPLALISSVYNAVAPRKMATEPSAADLHEGSTIEHQRFGVGEVVRIEGTGENTKATVQFRHAGTKQLLLKFAKFKILG